jgi:membrane-bound lytic murein transglycosylase D
MSSGPQEYTVRKGDCLSVIASKYGVSSREIRVANGMKSDRIIAGKKLIIPERGRYAGHKDKTGSKPESTKKEKNFEVDTNGYYTIRKGDSLSKIALKAKVSVRELQAWNNISDSAKIQVGEKILVKNKAVISADFVKKEPTIPSLLLPHDNPQNDADFFGTIDEIPVVQVRD